MENEACKTTILGSHAALIQTSITLDDRNSKEKDFDI